MSIAMPFPRFRFAFHRPTELRVDVDPASSERGEPLDALYDRMHSPGDRLHGLPALRLHDPHLRLRVREADGEFYAYVEDTERRCLAGLTVFNRLVEVSRRADRYLRSPHSRYLAQYQRRGIATAVYDWALSTGICLMTGARQSAGAHALWLSLGRRYESGYVDLCNKKLSYLGPDIDSKDLAPLQTRMFLLRKDWPLRQFCEAVGMQGAIP